MKEGWSIRWKALLIWLCGYLNIVAFIIAGGYAIVKSKNEELKKTTKQAFIVTLIFTLISMFFTVYSGFGGMSGDFYSSGSYTAYGVLLLISNIAKIIVFVICGAIAFFKGSRSMEEAETENKEEQNSEDGDLKI